MRVVVPLGELTRKLHAISSVVPGKTTMPILSTVLISAAEDGLWFSATDLDVSVTSRIGGSIEEGGSLAAPAKKLAEIVKSLSGEKVTLEAEDEKLVISCGKSRFVVNCRKADDFPKLPKQEGKTSFQISSELLGKLIGKTIYAVSTDLTRPALCGVLWEVDRKGLKMISTDGHRLAKVEVTRDLGGVQHMSVIVPPKALSALRSYVEDEEDVGISIGENSIKFETTDTSIYSRLLEGPFPNYEKVIPTKNDKELIVSREELGDATKRVAILSDALTHQVIFSLDKDKLVLHVNSQELGEAKEEVDVNFKAEPMSIGYNASYIMDILRTIDSEEISVMLDRADNAGLVKPGAESDEIKQMCIIMPLRIG